MRKKYTPVNPIFSIQKWGVRGFNLHGPVSVMTSHKVSDEDAKLSLLVDEALICINRSIYWS